jgi:hypothetical protein
VADKYHPLSNKVVIGDYTEEALSGHDIKVTGQIPYIPFSKRLFIKRKVLSSFRSY